MIDAARLGNKVTAERQKVVQTLVRTSRGRNPRLAKEAREALSRVYHVTAAETEKTRSSATP